MTISCVRAADSVNGPCLLFDVNLFLGKILVATISVPDHCLNLYHYRDFVLKNYSTYFQYFSQYYQAGFIVAKYLHHLQTEIEHGSKTIMV